MSAMETVFYLDSPLLERPVLLFFSACCRRYLPNAQGKRHPCPPTNRGNFGPEQCSGPVQPSVIPNGLVERAKDLSGREGALC